MRQRDEEEAGEPLWRAPAEQVPEPPVRLLGYASAPQGRQSTRSKADAAAAHASARSPPTPPTASLNGVTRSRT
jgi:hypothetical protein